MEQKVSISDDYAVLETKGFKFYYGYEEKANDEWAFVARKKSGTELARFSTSHILNNSADKMPEDEPWQYLLAGIGMFIDTHIL